MNDALRRSPTSYEPPKPPAFARYVWFPTDSTDRRIVCKCGNRFTPNYQLIHGSGAVRCRACRTMLFLIASTVCGIMVAETSPEDIAHMKIEGLTAVDELLYLQLRPVRTAA